MNTDHSSKAFNEARAIIPGGVNSPVRAFKAVGGNPVYFSSGEGPWLVDLDGNRFIDYVGSWGPMVLGHNHPRVRDAISAQLAKGVSFGTPHELETELARLITARIPSVDMVRMVSSGTEAAMTAIRLARGFTNRELIVKFEGCYHGHADALLVKAGSGALTLGVPSSPGVPKAVAEQTLTLEFNNTSQLQKLFGQMGESIAAVIVEPIAGNMNCVPPEPGFLEAMRELTSQSGSILIFDEVMTGFRVHPGSAQSLFAIEPDLTVLGKIIGGGLPVGAIGGRQDIMEHLAPTGPVYQAGTLSGNPLAMASGIATLEGLEDENFYVELERQTRNLCSGIGELARTNDIPLTTNYVCGMFGLFFTELPQISRFAQVQACDQMRFQQFFHGLLSEGVYIAPSAFEAGFVSGAHTAPIIDQTLEAMEPVFRALRG